MSKTGQCASTTSLSFANSFLVAELANVTVPCTPVKPERTPSSTAKNPRRSRTPSSLTETLSSGIAERCRVSAVRDLLASRQCRQDQFHRIRARV